MITKVYHWLASMLSCGTGMRDIRPHDKQILEVGDGDNAALGSRRCDLQRSYCFWQWCGPRRGGVALGWLSVVVWPAAALDGVTLGGGALGGGMALTLSGAALGGDSVSAAVGPSVTVWPSAAMCGSPELPCEPPCLIRWNLYALC